MHATRRNFFHLGLGLATAACSGDDGEDDMKPWHMWGNTLVVPTHVPPAPIGQSSHASQQLAQIIYGRPVSWKFYFSAKVISYDDLGIAPASRVVNVLFNVQLGVGRSTQVIKSFLRMDFELGTVGGPEVNVFRWATQVPQPLTSLTSTTQTFCDTLTAENIQCDAIVVAFNGGNGYDFTIELGAQFAPIDHIRPEWYSAAHNDHARFRGGENNGL